MRVCLLSLLGLLTAWAPWIAALHAQPARPEAPVIGDCRSAAQASEAAANLPSGLLLAIGRVETGRTDLLSGRVEPWPWATNHAGEGHFFASAQEAIRWVGTQQAAGIRSIDVGCFQINLHYHPDAFASLAEAFDPAANARYAAAFLNRLHDQSGNWPTAVALYHSADAFEGQRYASRVLEAWQGSGVPLRLPLLTLRSSDPVVVRVSAMAASVSVVVPGGTSDRAALHRGGPAVGLPRVITPSW